MYPGEAARERTLAVTALMMTVRENRVLPSQPNVKARQSPHHTGAGAPRYHQQHAAKVRMCHQAYPARCITSSARASACLGRPLVVLGG